jgi:hypothetical protein
VLRPSIWQLKMATKISRNFSLPKGPNMFEASQAGDY